MKIAFCDIDGVLNTPFTEDIIREGLIGYIGLDQDKLDRLYQIVKTTGAKIVLSSTWRKYPKFKAYLNERMKQTSPDFPDMVVGETPQLLLGSRADEIDAWLNEHNEHKHITQFIVLDDLTCNDFERFGNSFVQTYASEGLTDEIADKCIELLQKKLP